MICCKLHLESSLKRILNSKLSHFLSETLFQACLSSIEDLRVFSTISSRESHSKKHVVTILDRFTKFNVFPLLNTIHKF